MDKLAEAHEVFHKHEWKIIRGNSYAVVSKCNCGLYCIEADNGYYATIKDAIDDTKGEGDIPMSVEDELIKVELKEPKEQREGTCPRCGCIDLNYGDSEIDGGNVKYEWDCPKCKASGTEWYELRFAEHIYKEGK